VVLAMVPTPPRDRELPLAETVERPVGAPTVIALGADDAPTDAGPDLGRALGIFPPARRGAATPTADDARQIAAGGPSGVAAFASAPAPRRPDIADLIATAVSPRPTEHTAVRGRLIRPAAARDDGPPPVTAAAAPAPRAQEPAAKEVEQVASSWRPEPEEIEIPSGWHVQVGAYANASQAEDRLDTAKQAAKGLLAEATAFAMPVAKEQGTIYRARFAGLNKDAATRACTTLKRAKIDCIVVSQ
jgi:D-alanyl-D-alanine carboxypeptidase